jgi:rare lipoprotein A
MVRINDRGPGIEGRMIDLSWAAAKRLGYVGEGLTMVAVEVIPFAPVARPAITASRSAKLN